ncbi:MAG: hypothetical protein LQ343_006156 [Gyalolechia ehrenbergii]|nr:MAG: hypothetical protein LQ343_006156 [Gyalolechia ehrenbergii]
MVAPGFLFLILILPTLSLAWICYPPTHLLPESVDCVALILGLEQLSRLPADEGAKRWSRHLPSTERTEQLPKWYYIVEEQRPATCAIVVDADEREPSIVATFRLEDVVDAAKIVYSRCLIQKGQVGLEFPSEEGHVFAKVERLDRLPPGLLQLGTGGADGKGDGDGKNGGVRKEVLPNGMGVLYIADTEPGWRRNISETN